MTRDEFLAGVEIASHPPEPDDLRDAPLLNDWWISFEGRFLHLQGDVEDHPALGNGHITTSPLLAFGEPERWARTASRWYRLGGTWRDMAFEEQRSAGQSLKDGLRQLRAQLRQQ